MKVKNIIKLALKDLRRSKRNLILSSIGIAIGIWLLVLMVSFGEGIRIKLAESIKEITSLNLIQISPPYEGPIACYSEEECKDFKGPKPTKEISQEDEEKIKNFPEVKYLWRPYRFEIEYSINDKTVDFFALNSFPKEAFDITKTVNLIAGRFYQNDKEIIIEENTLKELGFKDLKEALGKEILVKPYIFEERLIKEEYYEKIPPEAKKYYYEQNLKIVGISKSSFLSLGENNLIDASLAEKIYQEYLTAKPQDILDSSLFTLSVIVKDSKDVGIVSQKIKNMGYEIESAQETIKMINSGFRTFNISLSIFGMIVLLASAIGISNTMYILVLQRKREIGILKAIGAKNKDILSIYLFEAVLIGILGALIGIFLAWICGNVLSFAITKVIQSEMKDIPFVSEMKGPILSPHISPQLFFGAILIAVFFSIIAAQRPAKQAAKMPPVEALRYE